MEQPVVDWRTRFSGVLQSRKFWSCVVGAVSLVLVHFGIAEIDVNVWVAAILTLVGIYSGSISLEDGLKHLAKIFSISEKEIIGLIAKLVTEASEKRHGG